MFIAEAHCISGSLHWASRESCPVSMKRRSWCEAYVTDNDTSLHNPDLEASIAGACHLRVCQPSGIAAITHHHIVARVLLGVEIEAVVSGSQQLPAHYCLLSDRPSTASKVHVSVSTAFLSKKLVHSLDWVSHQCALLDRKNASSR